jgi:superfamily II DNA/RNA helicase
MIDQLIEKVWSNPRLHEALHILEAEWLRRELGLPLGATVGDALAAKSMQAAAILACSQHRSHRKAAFRLATTAFELYGAENLPLDQALRVVLARLGNFPSIATRQSVDEASSRLPWNFLIEEFIEARPRTVDVLGSPVTLTAFQHDLWSKIHARVSVAASAPTSAGKSFVLQSFIRSLFSAEGSAAVLYLVPTRALIAQVAEDITNGFRLAELVAAPEVVTVPMEEGARLPSRVVWVLTQERAQLMLSAHPDFRVATVIVDEAQGIAEGARGILLQSVIDDILERDPNAQLLFASPSVSNLGVFSRVFAKPDLKIVGSSEPTVAQNFIRIGVISARGGKIQASSFDEVSNSFRELGEITVGHTLASRKEKLVHITSKLGSGQASLVFVNGPAEAEDVALQVASLRDNAAAKDKGSALINLIAETVHPKYVLIDCVSRGTGFHYSNIPTLLRRAIEQAFSDGDLDVLACTSTLLQGVNLPAKNIFMCSPEQGEAGPLNSVNFWNLSGRAGRLRREFQGNIYLIDYDTWEEKPLSGPRDSEIRPAIENGIINHTSEFIAVAEGRSSDASSGIALQLESAFVKLLSDMRSNRLELSLKKAGVEADTDLGRTLADALRRAGEKITLPPSVLKRSPSISGHKQQRLYEIIKQAIADGGGQGLLPAHPREPRAYDSYCNILELCHIILLERDTEDSNLHKFQALLSRKWMTGVPLPVIIDEQLKKAQGKSVRTVIRETLDAIEDHVRFRVVRLMSCYVAILEFALQEADLSDLLGSIPPIPLYLEVGASDQTMVSLISLGLSRVTAMKLNEAAPRKDFDVDAVRAWLAGERIESFGLSQLLTDEVQALVQGLSRG